MSTLEQQAQEIRQRVLELNHAVQELEVALATGRALNLETRLEDAFGSQIDMDRDGLKPLKLKVISIKHRVDL